VYGIDGDTGMLEWTFTVPGTSVWALEQLDDLTDDGIADIAVGDFNGYLFGIDPTDGSEIWSNYLGNVIILRFDLLDDVNGDDYADILPAHSGLFAEVVNGATGEMVWTTGLPDKSWCIEAIEDISGDGVNDVVIGTLFSNNYVFMLNGLNGSELFSINFGTPVDAMTVIPDIVGDGSWEIVAGGRNGKVICYSGGLQIPMGALEIGAIRGGLLKITAEISNIGDPVIGDISWNISVEDGILLTGRHVNGTLENLAGGETEVVTDKPVFGIGRLTISVTAWAPQTNVAVGTGEGFMFLFLVLAR
jgi:hypothetical protein